MSNETRWSVSHSSFGHYLAVVTQEIGVWVKEMINHHGLREILYPSKSLGNKLDKIWRSDLPNKTVKLYFRLRDLNPQCFAHRHRLEVVKALDQSRYKIYPGRITQCYRR